MKKMYATLALLLMANYGFSQFLPTGTVTSDAKYRTGSIGIGTSVAPTAKLEVKSGTTGVSGVKLTNMTSASATTAGNSKALSVDASGNIILTPVVNTAPTNTNIYNSDGTLTADRTMTMGGKNLTINPSTANSQFFVNGANGNVGIGTTTTTTGKLCVTNSLPDGTTFLDENDKNTRSLVINAGVLVGASTTSRQFKLYDWPVSNLNSKSMIWLGIEDRADMGRYRFYAETGGATTMVVYNKSQEEAFKVNVDENDYTYMQMGKPNSKVCIGGYADWPNSMGHKLFVQGGSAKVEGNILTDSNIGIGTSNFVDGVNTYRLSVKGKVRADEIKVYTTWADYVFAKDYILPSIKEVETYIATNGHLPNVPSGKEVEANGVNLGEMAKIQQEKIEELMLYIIEQNKRIEALETKLNNK